MLEVQEKEIKHTKKHKWIRVILPTGIKYSELRGLVDYYKLNTICTSGVVPIWENAGLKVRQPL